MNRAELVERVRSASDLTRAQAESVVDAVIHSVIDAVKSGERVSIFGFGSFSPTSRAARTGRNPRTGDPVKIAASRGVRFAPSAAFKSELNARRAGKKAAPATAAKAAGKKATGKAAGKAAGRPTKAAGRPATKAAGRPATKAVKSTKKR